MDVSQYLEIFLDETKEHLQNLNTQILELEQEPENMDTINEIFRAAHTLKGGSATVEMMELSHFTHSVEDVLDEIRSDRLSVDEDVVDLLLSSIDIIKAMLEARANGSVYEENIDDVVSKLHAYIPEKGEKKSKAAAAPKVVVQPVAAPVVQEQSVFKYPELTESDYEELKSALEGSQKLWRVAVQFDENNPMNSVGGIQVFAALKEKGYEVIGVSVDSAASHQKFIDKHELPFTLIADTDKKLVEAMGVWGEKSMYGRKYMGTYRTTFLINEEGIIEKIFLPKEIKTKTHAEQILSAIEA